MSECKGVIFNYFDFFSFGGMIARKSAVFGLDFLYAD